MGVGGLMPHLVVRCDPLARYTLQTPSVIRRPQAGALELFAALHSGGQTDAAATAAAATAAAQASAQVGTLVRGNFKDRGGSSAPSKASLLALPGGRLPHLTSPRRLAAAIAELARKHR